MHFLTRLIYFSPRILKYDFRDSKISFLNETVEFFGKKRRTDNKHDAVEVSSVLNMFGGNISPETLKMAFPSV